METKNKHNLKVNKNEGLNLMSAREPMLFSKCLCLCQDINTVHIVMVSLNIVDGAATVLYSSYGILFRKIKVLSNFTRTKISGRFVL